jgi:hypothetical protein
VTDAVSHEEREKDERDSSSVVVVEVIIDGLSIDDDTEGADAMLEWSDTAQACSRGMETSDVSSASSKKVAIVAYVRQDWMDSPPRPCSIGS